MSGFKALEFAKEPANLAEFARYLRGLGFPHRISEQGGKLIVWVADESHATWVQTQYQMFNEGLLDISLPLAKSHIRWPNLRSIPLTVLLISLCVAGFSVVWLNALNAVSWLSFQGFTLQSVDGKAQVVMNTTSEWLGLMQKGQWWRLFTPMFLHFDWTHLAFNITLLGFFASQLERQRGFFWLLSTVLILSLAANVAQFVVSDHLFGGMSGVNYGLIAYCAVINRRSGQAIYQCPPGLFWVSLVMMMLGFLNLFSLFGYSIANWAHLGGFVAGIVLALIAKSPHEAKALS